MTETPMDRETAERIKRNFNVVGESLRWEIRTVAEGFVATNERLVRIESRMSEEFSGTKANVGAITRVASKVSAAADVKSL